MMTLADPVSEEHPTALQHFMQISYAEFPPGRLVSMENMGANRKI
jgi:hypothetical protein